MRPSHLLTALLPLSTHALNVVVSNDDGWAEINIRQLYEKLTAGGFAALISAPADNKSGTGSSDAEPTTVGSKGCEFASCAPGSPAYGSNASEPRFNYVNSYPVTSMRHGLLNLSRTLFPAPHTVDLAVAGPNVGNNLGAVTLFSGTVGAATEAVKNGIPGLAFSGASGSQTGWDIDPVPAYASIYGELSARLSKALVGRRRVKGENFLPDNVWLNVNFPAVTEACGEARDFKFVLSRINLAGLLTGDDVVTCGNGGRLPTESTVVGTEGCYVAVSVGFADSKGDATSEEQEFVLKKLKRVLSCLPST